MVGDIGKFLSFIADRLLILVLYAFDDIRARTYELV